MKKWLFIPLWLLTVAGYGQEYSSDAIETATKPKFKAATSIKISATVIVIQTQGQPAQRYQVNEVRNPMKEYTTWSTNDETSLAYDEGEQMMVVTKGNGFTAYHNLRRLKP